MNLNEKHKKLFIPQWFDKSHLESFLNKNLTDKQFQILKNHLIDSSGSYLADLISEQVRILLSGSYLNELKEIYPEIFS